MKLNYKGNQVRTVKRNNEIWWVLTDVCKVLGLTNPSRTASRLDEDERSNLELGRQGNVNIINESGLYSVILRSDKAEAKPFRKWVTSEVLPSIRRTGSYSVEQGKQTTMYEYYDKFLNGVPVMTVLDVEHFTGISVHMIDYYLARKPFKRGTDFIYLIGNELKAFKQENPRISKMTSGLNVITKSGFDKLLKRAGTKAQTPECFKQLPPPRVNDLDKAKAKLEKIRHRMEVLGEVLDDYEHRYRYNKMLGESPREYAWIVAADIMTEIQHLPIKGDLFA